MKQGTELARSCVWFAALILTAGLGGCRHKEAQVVQPTATAPAATSGKAPAPITVITPLPSVPPQANLNVKPEAASPAPAPNQPAPAEAKRPRAKRAEATGSEATNSIDENSDNSTDDTSQKPGKAATKQKGNETTVLPSSPAATQAAAAEASPALGQLSTGTALSRQARTELLSQIDHQQGRIQTIKKPQTKDEEAILTQVRAFLEKARQAVAANDLDGAKTLSTKAGVLLDELESE